MVFFSVPQKLLTLLLATNVPEECMSLINIMGTSGSLMSVVALSKLPRLSRSASIAELASAASSLLRGMDELS
jgi:hypothetical protein